MSENLKHKTQKGLIWSLIDNFGSQGVQFIFAVVVARMLTPEAYGIVAMPMIFLAISNCFIDSGFANALVRKPELKEEDLSTAFYFNIGVGAFFYFLLFLSSPLIADFYNEPILIDLLRVSALALLFNPLCTVQQALLTREIDFKRQTWITLVGTCISGFVAAIMAYKGFGVWALVFQQVVTYFIRTILLWSITSWIPRSGWSKESFRYLWGYGSKMLASGLLNETFKNLSPLIIGKFYTSADLGNYTRALHYSNLPSKNVTSVLQRVTFPVLASIQNDNERLCRNYRKIIRMSAFMIFPLMMFLAGLSKPLIILMLTDKWLGCVVYLEILCFTQMWYPIHAINLNLLQVKGRSDLFFKLEVIKKIIGLIAMGISLPLGVLYFVISGIVTSILSLFVNTYYTGKLYDLTFLKQMYDVLPTFAVSFFSWIGIHLFIMMIPNVYIQFFGGFVVGLILFLIGAKLFLRKELYETSSMLPGKVRNNKFLKCIFE